MQRELNYTPENMYVPPELNQTVKYTQGHANVKAIKIF